MVLVIKGGVIHTVTRGTISGGAVIVEGGRITFVGPLDKARIPGDAEIIDAEGMHVMPGMIDPHSHLGVAEQGVGWEGRDTTETTEPITPHLRALDAVKTDDMGFQEAAEAGVTTVGVLPGSGNPIAGLAAALKTHGESLLDMVLREPVGMKMAFGENPRRIHGLEAKRSPATRMAVAGLIREWLVKAENYARKKELFKDQPEKLPDRDLRLEALEQLLRGVFPARSHAHRADDILTAIRLAEEFGYRLIIDHGTEAYRIAGILAEKHIPVVVGPLLSSRYKVELRGKTMKTPAILAEHGVTFALTTDHPVTPIRLLPVEAGLAMREGLSFNDALKAVTINAARILGVDERVGSLEEGKDADIVVLSGRPFDMLTRTMYTIINGRIVYRAEEG